MVRPDAEPLVPAFTLLYPVVEPLLAFRRRYEELQLHLLELARPKRKVPGRDLVTERLPDLGDAERRLHPHSRQHGFEIQEDPLTGLRTQIGNRRIVLYRSHKRLEHQVEL